MAGVPPFSPVSLNTLEVIDDSNAQTSDGVSNSEDHDIGGQGAKQGLHSTWQQITSEHKLLHTAVVQVCQSIDWQAK
jgi:hypothetical protein